MESIPYDKRSGKIWFNGKTVNWADAIFIFLTTDCIMQVACLKVRGFMMEKYLSLNNILKDFFILLIEWVLRFLTLNQKLMKLAKV